LTAQAWSVCFFVVVSVFYSALAAPAFVYGIRVNVVPVFGPTGVTLRAINQSPGYELFMAVIAFSIFYASLSAVLCVVNRNHPVIKSRGWTFTFLIISAYLASAIGSIFSVQVIFFVQPTANQSFDLVTGKEKLKFRIYGSITSAFTFFWIYLATNTFLSRLHFFYLLFREPTRYHSGKLPTFGKPFLWVAMSFYIFIYIPLHILEFTAAGTAKQTTIHQLELVFGYMMLTSISFSFAAFFSYKLRNTSTRFSDLWSNVRAVSISVIFIPTFVIWSLIVGGGQSSVQVSLFAILMAKYVFFVVVSDNFVLPIILAHLGAFPEQTIDRSATSNIALI